MPVTGPRESDVDGIARGRRRQRGPRGSGRDESVPRDEPAAPDRTEAPDESYPPIIGTVEGADGSAFEVFDWFLAAVPTLAWGSSFLLIRESLAGLHPGAVAWLRVLLGAAVLSSVPSARRARIAPHDRWRVLVVALGWMAIPMSLFPVAQQWLSSSVVGMLNGSLPVLAAVIAAVLLRRLPGRKQMGGLVIGMAGIVLLSLPSFDAGSDAALGAVLTLGAMIAYATAVNVMVPLQHAYGSLPVLLRALGMAAVVTAPFGIAGLIRSSFPIGPVLAVSTLGVIGTGIAFVPAGMLIGRVGATRGTITAYLSPIVALVLGVSVGGEAVEPIELGGLALTTFGAWVTSREGG